MDDSVRATKEALASDDSPVNTHKSWFQPFWTFQIQLISMKLRSPHCFHRFVAKSFDKKRPRMVRFPLASDSIPPVIPTNYGFIHFISCCKFGCRNLPESQPAAPQAAPRAPCARSPRRGWRRLRRLRGPGAVFSGGDGRGEPRVPEPHGRGPGRLGRFVFE